MKNKYLKRILEDDQEPDTCEHVLQQLLSGFSEEEKSATISELEIFLKPFEGLTDILEMTETDPNIKEHIGKILREGFVKNSERTDVE